MSNPVYTVGYDHNHRWFPNGPGDGFGYYSGTLHPETRFDSNEEVEKICTFLNLAYEHGYEVQKHDTLVALGIELPAAEIQALHKSPYGGMLKVAFDQGRISYQNKVKKTLKL